jgi:thiol-disulfide isomerase/thioredoxin
MKSLMQLTGICCRGLLVVALLVAPAHSGSPGGSEFKGQVVLINFWATWCGPCRKEMPLLEQLYQRYEPLGFTLLGVNVEEQAGDAEKFLGEVPVSFPVLWDPENQVSKLYDVSAMPSTVLVDREGNMRFLHHGYQEGYENAYQDQIRTLVRERT